MGRLSHENRTGEDVPHVVESALADRDAPVGMRWALLVRPWPSARRRSGVGTAMMRRPGTAVAN